MVRNLALAIGCASVLVLVTARAVPTAAQAQYASESDAKAMLDKAVVALKQNKEKALEMFNKGEGGVAKKGFPVGKEIMQNATEGQIKEVTYFWPRPGTEKPLEKRSFYTKVAGQDCGWVTTRIERDQRSWVHANVPADLSV